MSDGGNSEELRELAADPGTPQATIAQLAYEYPWLRATVAANPAAYDGLLEWLRQFDDPEISAALDARAGVVTDAAARNLEPASPLPTPAAISNDRTATGWSRWPAFLTTRFVIVLASIVVLAIVGTIVAVSAHNAAVSAQEAADQKAAQAVADFENAATACKSANSALSTAVANAATTVTTDPSSLADPALIDALKAARTKNSAAPLCTAPEMAKDTDAINAQTTALRSATSVVGTAAVSLQQAIDTVTASVQAKKDAAAAAAAAADAAARTWHMDAGNGYTYDVSLAVGAPTTGATGSGNTVGGVCSDFNPATDLAVPYTLTVRSTTKDFAIPSLSVSLFTYAFGGVGLTSGSWYIGSNVFSATEAGTYEAEEYFSGNSSTCWQPGQSLSAGNLAVQWSNGLAAGATNTWNFTFIVKGYKSPSHPSGNPALLSSIGLSPQLAIFWVSGDKALTLNNTVIGR